MTSSSPSDPTFRSYSVADAKIYATHRLSYSQSLYDVVLQHHASTGGQFQRLLDVGCGPGNATRDVALSFNQAVGVDPGEQMIAAAKELGGKTSSGEDIEYRVSPAESISSVEGLEEGSVDLLTSAMAAHWFDMNKLVVLLFVTDETFPGPETEWNWKAALNNREPFTRVFWAEAAKVVKPGGTVALWTCYPSTPNASEVMKICLKFEREILRPYEMPGNRVSMNMYDELALPWDVSSPVEVFPKSKYVKHEYDRDGILSNGKTFFAGGKVETLENIGKGLQTASMVTRWKAASPDLVGSKQDIVKIFINDLKEAMGGQDWAERGSGTAILLFKRADI